MSIHSSTSFDDLFAEAQKAISDVEPGESFTVRDLFRGIEWNRLPMGTRRVLGSAILDYVRGPWKDQVAEAGKTPQNQQIYIKK